MSIVILVLLIILISVLLLLYISLVKFSKAIGFSTLKEFFDEIKRGMRTDKDIYSSPKNLSDMTKLLLPIIQNDFPTFNKEQLFTLTKTNINEILDAIEAKDISKIKDKSLVFVRNKVEDEINKLNEINKNDNDINIINNTKKSTKTKQIENFKDKNNILFDIETNNEEINFDNIDKLLSSEKINFQDKINIISELNKNIDKYSNAMPLIINQVQNSLDKIYKNNKIDSNFRKEADKVPYIAMASKTAYQLIQTNIDFIIEAIINELLLGCALDFKEIRQKKLYLIKRYEMVKEFDLAKNNLNDILGKEKNIYEENVKFIEDKKIEIDNINNNIKDNKIIIKKYKINIDEELIKSNDKYKNDFREYMQFKGSFYAENIFDIYDEYIEEEANSLLDKMVNQIIEKINLN
jgi:hypothetical protein